jgi:hypothetical protein
MPVPLTDPDFDRDPLPAMLSWATDPADPPVRRLTADRYLVTDPSLGRRVLASTRDPFEAISAPFGAVPGWIPGHPDTRPLLTALTAALDTTVDPGTPAGGEAGSTGYCWPDAASRPYLRRFGGALLPGAVCRAAAMALSWTVLLDHGWCPGLPAGTVLPAATPTAPPADRVREALRLWPVAWMLHRRARETAVLGRVRVRPGDHLPGACVGARFVNAAAVEVPESQPGPVAPIALLDERPVLGALAAPPRFQFNVPHNAKVAP